MRSLWRTCSLLAGGILIVACGDPDLKTDLDTEGPPEVNIVTVTNEGPPIGVNGGPYFEAPTFCRADGGRVNREICPSEDGAARTVDPRADVNPVGWQVRFVFSELLDPNVEDLVEVDGSVIGSIADTQPVTITCGGNAVADYDGHYDPSGNDVSAPPGPSLVVNVGGFAAAAGSGCEISLVGAVVKDKDNNQIPSAEAGPYAFTLANLHLAGSDPAPAFDPDMNLIPVEGFAVTDAMGMPTAAAILFNAPLDGTTVTEADVTLTLEDGTAVPGGVDITVAGDAVLLAPTTGFEFSTTYKASLLAASDITDALGGTAYDAPAAPFEILFTTEPPPPVDAAP